MALKRTFSHHSADQFVIQTVGRAAGVSIGVITTGSRGFFVEGGRVFLASKNVIFAATSPGRRFAEIDHQVSYSDFLRQTN